MDVLNHPSHLEERENIEIVGIWGLGCPLDTNHSLFLSHCTQDFRYISPFFFDLVSTDATLHTEIYLS